MQARLSADVACKISTGLRCCRNDVPVTDSADAAAATVIAAATMALCLTYLDVHLSSCIVVLHLLTPLCLLVDELLNLQKK